MPKIIQVAVIIMIVIILEIGLLVINPNKIPMITDTKRIRIFLSFSFFEIVIPNSTPSNICMMIKEV